MLANSHVASIEYQITSIIHSHSVNCVQSALTNNYNGSCIQTQYADKRLGLIHRPGLVLH